jgi:hypothetical protein
MSDDLFHHEDPGPSGVVAQTDMGDVTVRVVGARSASGADDLAAQENPHHRGTEIGRAWKPSLHKIPSLHKNQRSCWNM